MCILLEENTPKICQQIHRDVKLMKIAFYHVDDSETKLSVNRTKVSILDRVSTSHSKLSKRGLNSGFLSQKTFTPIPFWDSLNNFSSSLNWEKITCMYISGPF